MERVDISSASNVEMDPEKATPAISIARLGSEPCPPSNNAVFSVLQKWNTRIESLSGFEKRGITRVLPDERQPASTTAYIQMVLLWLSANVSMNNLVVGLYGPLLFQLGYLDSSLCAVFAVMLGAIGPAYMATWGAESGCRTMVVVRYAMGYYPANICVVLNILVVVGYSTVNAIIGGQMLSAVSGGTMTIAVGIVIITIVVLFIAVVGLKVFHVYERYAWFPQLLILFIFIGSAGPYFNTSLSAEGSTQQINANRLSFFSLCYYSVNSWAPCTSDYYVYYPESTRKWHSFTLTYTGLLLSFSLVDLLGVGLASGVATHPVLETAYSTSAGALVTAGFAPLASFGKFCSVVVCFGLVANSVPAAYSAALNAQMIGRHSKRVPRWIWTVFIVLIELVCALAGRNEVFVVFQNILALMGYWVMIMVCIIAEEHVLFRWRRRVKFDWSAWDDKSRLPVGIAALISFSLGWMGAVLGMYQVWFVGPIAKMVGDVGGDVGMWVGCGFTLIVFPVLRWAELRIVGR